MSARSIIAVMLALVFGGSAAVGVNTYVNKVPAAVNADMVKVVVAAADLPRGILLTPLLLKELEVRKALHYPPPITITELLGASRS